MLLAEKYQLSRQLGAGAMGTVWSARNLLTEREVAIKLLNKDRVGDDEARRRMLREASACGRLSHPNVVQVLDLGTTDDGAPFLVMELLKGESLAERITRLPRMEVADAIFVAQGILRALVAAHAAGIVHRDLKPGNVFLHDDPHYGTVVKVVDFGISKVLGRADSSTLTGLAIGSPGYMSPEQARGETRRLDHRSDLWSFGVVLFELLAGRAPFAGDSAFEVVSEILKGTIPRVTDVDPEADPRLSALVDRCLVRDIEERLATAAQAMALLELCAGADPAPAEEPTRAKPARHPAPHGRAIAGLTLRIPQDTGRQREPQAADDDATLQRERPSISSMPITGGRMRAPRSWHATISALGAWRRDGVSPPASLQEDLATTIAVGAALVVGLGGLAFSLLR